MKSDATESGVGEGGTREVGPGGVHEHPVEGGDGLGADVVNRQREKAEGLASPGGVDEEEVTVVVGGVVAGEGSVEVTQRRVEASQALNEGSPYREVADDEVGVPSQPEDSFKDLSWISSGA